MNIQSAFINEHGGYTVHCDDGVLSVPAFPGNRHYDALMAWVAAGGVLEPAPVPEPVVPQVVSRFQARAALHLAGLLPQVEALMADPETDSVARIAWADAQEFHRDSPTLISMGAALGLTEQDIDNLFIQAANITA